MPVKQSAYAIESIDEARKRILELEGALDDAFEIILKRDAQLEGYERKLVSLGVDLTDQN